MGAACARQSATAVVAPESDRFATADQLAGKAVGGGDLTSPSTGCPVAEDPVSRQLSRNSSDATPRAAYGGNESEVSECVEAVSNKSRPHNVPQMVLPSVGVEEYLVEHDEMPWWTKTPRRPYRSFDAVPEARKLADGPLAARLRMPLVDGQPDAATTTAEGVPQSAERAPTAATPWSARVPPPLSAHSDAPAPKGHEEVAELAVAAAAGQPRQWSGSVTDRSPSEVKRMAIVRLMVRSAIDARRAAEAATEASATVTVEEAAPAEESDRDEFEVEAAVVPRPLSPLAATPAAAASPPGQSSACEETPLGGPTAVDGSIIIEISASPQAAEQMPDDAAARQFAVPRLQLGAVLPAAPAAAVPSFSSAASGLAPEAVSAAASSRSFDSTVSNVTESHSDRDDDSQPTAALLPLSSPSASLSE